MNGETKSAKARAVYADDEDRLGAIKLAMEARPMAGDLRTLGPILIAGPVVTDEEPEGPFETADDAILALVDGLEPEARKALLSHLLAGSLTENEGMELCGDCRFPIYESNATTYNGVWLHHDCPTAIEHFRRPLRASKGEK